MLLAIEQLFDFNFVRQLLFISAVVVLVCRSFLFLEMLFFLIIMQLALSEEKHELLLLLLLKKITNEKISKHMYDL